MKRPHRFSSTSTVENSPSGPVRSGGTIGAAARNAARRTATLLIAFGMFVLASVLAPAAGRSNRPARG